MKEYNMEGAICSSFIAYRKYDSLGLSDWKNLFKHPKFHDLDRYLHMPKRFRKSQSHKRNSIQRFNSRRFITVNMGYKDLYLPWTSYTNRINIQSIILIDDSFLNKLTKVQKTIVTKTWKPSSLFLIYIHVAT